jgi:hypothetical protein
MVVLLLAEFERAESFWSEKNGPNYGFGHFGPNTQKGRKKLGQLLFELKMSETSSSGPKRVCASDLSCFRPFL